MLRRTFLKLLAAVGVGSALPKLPSLPAAGKAGIKVIRGGKICVPHGTIAEAAHRCCCGELIPASITVTITGLGDGLKHLEGKVNSATRELQTGCGECKGVGGRAKRVKSLA